MRSGRDRRRRRGLHVSAAAKVSRSEPVGRVGAGAPRSPASRIRAGDVAVEVADQDEADVVGPGQDAADVGRPERRPRRVAGPIGRVSESRPPERSAQDAWLERLVDVVGVAAAGVQPDDDVERRRCRRRAPRPQARCPVSSSSTGAKPMARAHRDQRASGCPTRRR